MVFLPELDGSVQSAPHLGQSWRRTRAAGIVALGVASLLFASVSSTASKLQKPIRIVALGDSLTAGYMLPQRDAFPSVLGRALKAAKWNVTIANAGVSGDTAADGLNRLDWSIGEKVDGVIVELGANDMLRGIDPAVTRKALSAILAKLKGRGIKILLCGMYADPALGRRYGQTFQRIYPSLARKFDVPLYPFFLKGVAGVPNLELADGMHPNVEGVHKIVESMLPKVESFLLTINANDRS